MSPEIAHMAAPVNVGANLGSPQWQAVCSCGYQGEKTGVFGEAHEAAERHVLDAQRVQGDPAEAAMATSPLNDQDRAIPDSTLEAMEVCFDSTLPTGVAIEWPDLPEPDAKGLRR